MGGGAGLARGEAGVAEGAGRPLPAPTPPHPLTPIPATNELLAAATGDREVSDRMG